MAPRERLSVKQAAALVGIKPSTWRPYVKRGLAPKPDGREAISGMPWWYRSTVEAWLASRPGVPGRPRKSA